MGFESCHPAVNFLFFAAVIYGSVAFQHPVFLAISCLCAFAFSMKRNGKRAVIFNLCLLPLVVCFALYYSSYHHFGVTVLKQNFIGNNLTVESFVYGMVTGLRAAAVCMWLSCLFRVVSSDKVLYLFGRVSPRLSLFLTILLRFIPRIGREARKINLAQKGIGRGSNQGNLFRRLVNCLRIFSMLITWMISALALESDSMRSRGSLLRGTDGIFHLPLRQPGQGVRDRAVFRHHPDCHGGDPWGDDDVLQSQNHLEAIGKRKRSDRRRLRRAVSAAHGAGILDGIPVP